GNGPRDFRRQPRAVHGHEPGDFREPAATDHRSGVLIRRRAERVSLLRDREGVREDRDRSTTTGVIMDDVNDLVERYVAVWNESDPTRRRSLIADLWTEDAVHLLQPPQVVREAARDLNLIPVFQVRGHRP